MPEMSGIDFIREMKKRNYRIPVIVVSASKMHESILALKSDSVRQVFEKPLQAEPFIIAVQEALKQKK